MALATVSTLLPQILITLVGGAWADRFSRKWLIMGSNGAIALLTLVLALFWSQGIRSLWLLILFAALRSIGQGIQQPAVSSAYPQLVPEYELTRINGINQTLMSLSTIISPVVGGLILANFNLYWALMIDVFTAAIELLCMIKITLNPVQVSHNNESIKQNEQALLAGLKYLFSNLKLRRLFTINAFSYLLMTPASVLSLLLIQRQFGANVTNLTLQEIMWGGGSIISGLLVAKKKEFKDNERVLGMAVGGFSIAMITMGFMPTMWLYLLTMFLAGWSFSYIMTTQAVIIQTTAAPEFMGRTFSAYQMIGSLMLLIGTLGMGPLADVVPLVWIFAVSGLILLTAAGWYLRAIKR